jgi:nucleoside-diphosphate-sugar epimerase
VAAESGVSPPRRRALVTGGAGFIGSHLVEGLLAAGWDVRALDDLSTGREAHLAAVRDRIELWRGDVRDGSVVEKAVEGIEAIFHAAAVASAARSVEEPIATHAVNVMGTLTVLEAARAARVRRVVFASSSAVYGASAEPPTREDAPRHPSSPYGLHKATCEDYCRLYAEIHGLETVALRYFNVFGPRQDSRSDYAAVIPRFVQACLAGEAPRIFGDGRQTRDFVHVEDVVRASLLAVDAQGVAGRSLNVGTGRETSVSDLAATIAELVGGGRAPVGLPERAWEPRRSAADPGAARRLLGFEPRVSLRQGLRGTIASLRARRGADPEGDGDA